ncbi:unnamed protein product [Rotaria socialis]|uniref:BTB domain-containing protein n=2 Tax=Rotaria socialis TaxID=392032 RepID=A0A818X646_9BILA|nr:unnamed protein product [Rotaria socialis]
MTDSKSGKVPKIGTLVYDSGIDTASDKKRAVLPGGGISVAERARLFGAQVPNASPFKPSKPTNLPVQRIPQNNRAVKPNVAFHDANYEPLKPKIDIYEYPKQETSIPSSQQANNDYRRFIRAEDRRRYDQQQPSSDSRNHSAANRSRNHSQHSSSASQRSTNTYDRDQYEPKKKYTPGKPNSTKRIRPIETYAHEDDDYDDYDDYEEDEEEEVEQAPYLKFYNPRIPPQNTTSQPSNYFQPIQDPLEALMMGSSQGYYQEQPPTTTSADTNDLQPFDLGNLISRIQQDYAENVRPYVSSVQFVETNPSVVNLGYITPAGTRKDYMRRPNETYRRLGSSGNYDIIDTNGLYPYEKIPPKAAYSTNQYSPMARKRVQRRPHNQASSSIHTVEYASKTRTQRKPEHRPPATTRKESTPAATSEDEEEEEKEEAKESSKAAVATAAAAAVATKAKKAETSSEYESEEEEGDHESVAKPATNSPPQASSQPANEETRAPVVSTAPVAAQRIDTARPAIANPTPAKKVESEESETEESESESESDSDEDEKPKPPPNTRTTAAALQTTARGATITPQTNARGAPIASQANNRGAPITQIGSARVNQQQPTADHYSTNGPPEEHAEETDSYNFENTKKSLSFGVACDVLRELRNSGEYCDVTLRMDDQQSFKVHRAILCSCSSFFRALFTNGMNETTDRIVDIHDIKGDTMNLIIDFIYTHEITLNENNIYEILPATNQLQVLELFSLCENYLYQKLSPENAIGIREFASFFYCKNLSEKAEIYLLTNFIEISIKSDEFLELDLEQIIHILNSDELNVRSEQAVFDAVIRWIDYRPDERKKNIVDLLKCVRLGLLTTNFFIEKVKCHPYIINNDTCKPLVIDTLKYLYELDVDTYQKDLSAQNPIARPRLPHEILFVCGGWSGGSPTATIELYDTRADKWFPLPFNDRFPRAYHGIATINNFIYVIGGFDGMDYFNSCRSFDLQTLQWNEIAPMYVKRCYVSVVVLNGFVYAMGGFDGHSRQNTAERYSPKSNQWLPIPPMHSQRSDASATVLQETDRIYICGGFNGQECMNSAEYFDPKTNQWTMIAPMRNRRSGIGVVAYHNSIYAIGGFNGSTRMNSGERYNPRTNTWMSIPDMYNPRSNFAIEVIDDYLFVIGGFNGVTTIFNVECFDDISEEWYDAADMNIFRSALSVCILAGLDHVRNLITFARKQSIDEEKSKDSSIISQHTTSPTIIPVGTLSAAVGALSSTIDLITANNL